MPGLAGFAGTPPDGGAEKLLGSMLFALEPGEGYLVEQYHHRRAGLGRVSLGIVNQDPNRFGTPTIPFACFWKAKSITTAKVHRHSGRRPSYRYR
jgi:hypothetical protein